MDCRAIIVDFDRTLLHTDKTISEYTVKVLLDLQKSGVRLFAATARPERAVTEYCEYRTIDIQDIPFEDHTFDVVIANMMLYHVPDLQRGLREVKRVLKKDGTFYLIGGENNPSAAWAESLSGMPGL